MAVAHHEHGGGQKMDGVAMAQKSKLFVGSLDGSLPPRAITGGVCYCCKTALVSEPSGRIYAAWRHVYSGNLRDMAFAMSRDGGRAFSEPVRVSQDQWVLEGCPDDGPSMAVDPKARVHLVWPTLVPGEKNDQTIGIFYATSADGSTFSARERIPTEGIPHHPRLVALGDGQLIAAWDESGDGTRRIAIGRGRPDPKRPHRVSAGDTAIDRGSVGLSDDRRRERRSRRRVDERIVRFRRFGSTAACGHRERLTSVARLKPSRSAQRSAKASGERQNRTRTPSWNDRGSPTAVTCRTSASGLVG